MLHCGAMIKHTIVLLHAPTKNVCKRRLHPKKDREEFSFFHLKVLKDGESIFEVYPLEFHLLKRRDWTEKMESILNPAFPSITLLLASALDNSTKPNLVCQRRKKGCLCNRFTIKPRVIRTGEVWICCSALSCIHGTIVALRVPWLEADKGSHDSHA